MSENKLKPKDMGLVLSVKECLKTASDIVQHCKERQKSARTSASKRSAQQSIELWSAIAYHLERLKTYDSHEQA